VKPTDKVARATALGTVPMFTKCVNLGSQWTALKPTFVSTRNRGFKDGLWLTTMEIVSLFVRLVES
jgi:hypothetical protein